MRTTPAERREAVSLAKRLLATPGIADDVKLLCATVADCADIFAIHAPVIAACRSYITPDGKYGHGWAALVAAVTALHAYEKERT